MRATQQWRKLMDCTYWIISIWLFYICRSSAQVSLNSRISVEENNSWISFNGDFAIGFFERADQSFQYSLGIRFNSRTIPPSKQAAVWVAGADFAVGNSSFFELSSDGNLRLFDSSKGETVWASETNQMDVASAIMRNDGNFILMNSENAIVWQSFDYPSDTLLPGQTFPAHKKLRAASRNSVSSYYSLYMNISGELQLRWESHYIYWKAGAPGLNLSAVLTSGGALQLVQGLNFNPVWSAFGDDHNVYRGYRFLRLDRDGNLRMYSWDSSDQSWRSVWQAVEDQCKVFATCELLGICLYNASGSPECHCPYQVSPDLSTMCLTQSCHYGYSMITFNHTFLYELYSNETVIVSSLPACKSFCEMKPDCVAATFANDGTAKCSVKTSPFFSGYSEPSLPSVSFVKTCSIPVAVDPHGARMPSSLPSGKHSSILCVPCILGTISGAFLVFLIAQFAIAFLLYKRRKWMYAKAEMAFRGYNSKGLMILSLAEIAEISQNFKQQLAPKMYKGILPSRRAVAIREVEVASEERKFRGAVTKMSSIHHRNLVKLEGYCCESEQKFLVYEFCKHGTLKKHLEDHESGKKLTWKSRFEIILSVGRALSYLHTGCRDFICHGNLTCENVLLDKGSEAKLCDFGFNLFQTEIPYGGERDVECFGRMILETLTGRFDYACHAAYDEWLNGRSEEIVDRRIVDDVDMEMLERALRIAFWCVQDDKRLSPSMDEVVKVLEGVLKVDPPPPPFAGRRLSGEGDSVGSGAHSPGESSVPEV